MIELQNHDDAYLIASTRFNAETYAANQRYRRKHGISVIYGTNTPICDIHPKYAVMFVLEMNNSTNVIEGIGRIRNQLYPREMKNIYTNIAHSEYNAFFYKGTKWVSRDIIQKKDPDLLIIFENMLFKKKTHIKRQGGITVITEKLLSHWMEDKTRLTEGLRKLLVRILALFGC
jgi:hypothetical protein